jgi:uncharacterized protein
MNAWFADTSFFLAFVNEHDAGHSRAVMTLRELEGSLITTPWVLVEVANAVSASQRRASFTGLLHFLRGHSRVVITPLDPSALEKGIDLYAQRSDKEWSLTDCISFVAMKEYNVTAALTSDHHFEQAGFKALLR